MAEKKKKKKIQSVRIQSAETQDRSGSRKDALELATSRARSHGIADPALRGGQIITGEDLKKEEAMRIAEKNVAVDKAEAELVPKTTLQATTEEAPQEIPQEEKTDKGFKAKDTVTDATGFARDIEISISEKAFKTAQQSQLTQDIAVLGLAAPIGRGVNIAANPAVNTIFKTIMTKKALTSLGTSVAGADIIGTWYAADNVQSAIPFHLKEVRKGLADGTLDPAKAEELVTEAQDNFDKAGSFITKSTRINPILWAFRNLYMSGQEQKQAEIDIIVNSMIQ